MITIDVKPARVRFGLRKQWKFAITGGNHEPIDPRDTYANTGDIRKTMLALVNSDEPVQLRTHYLRGTVTERIR